MKKNENENLDSEDGIKGFFDIVLKNIKKLNSNELKIENKPTQINNSLNSLWIIDNPFCSIFKS